MADFHSANLRVINQLDQGKFNDNKSYYEKSRTMAYFHSANLRLINQFDQDKLTLTSV